MKKIAIILFCLAFALSFSTQVSAGGKRSRCTTIEEGKIVYPPNHYFAGEKIKLGYDGYGYNYQGHIFNGWAVNFQVARFGLPPYEGSVDDYYDSLVEAGLANSLPEAEALMKQYVYGWPDSANDWVVSPSNDAWLSNKDCDGDGFLDGGPRVVRPGSGGWATYLWRGNYQIPNGPTCVFDSSVTSVVVPKDAVLKDSGDVDFWGYPIFTWYVGKREIGRHNYDFGGPGTHAVAKILETYNDPCYGVSGIIYVAPNIENGSLGGVDWSSAVEVPVKHSWKRH